MYQSARLELSGSYKDTTLATMNRASGTTAIGRNPRKPMMPAQMPTTNRPITSASTGAGSTSTMELSAIASPTPNRKSLLGVLTDTPGDVAAVGAGARVA